MTILLILASVFALNDFSSFTYCRQNSRGDYELQCVKLDSAGKGEVNFKRREAEAVNVEIQLSPPATMRFIDVLAATNYLEDAQSYESGRKIADLGKKHLTLETTQGTREATYNFSDRKEVMNLTAFFEALINQETLIFDLDNAVQFERLSVPKRLDQIEAELKAKRIADPARLIPILEKIESDQRLMNYARTEAVNLKKQIQTAK